MEKLAASIVDTLSGEHYIKAVVGIGTPISNVKDLATSFKEAQIAMEVSKVFDTEKQIIRYDNLGIARLIYQLPTTLCDMFLREVFKQGSIEAWIRKRCLPSSASLRTTSMFPRPAAACLSTTNTLVYRLEKDQKRPVWICVSSTMPSSFKVALMVKITCQQPGQILTTACGKWRNKPRRNRCWPFFFGWRKLLGRKTHDRF